MSRSAALGLIALIGGALFIYATSNANTWLAFATKPVPVLMLLLWLSDSCVHTYRRWIMIGLGLSILGDLALAWPRDLFVVGLAAFLFAHLAYLRAYVVDTRAPAPSALLVASVGGTGLFSLLAWHNLGDLLIPVASYTLTISVMLWRALACGGLAAFGALSFVLSDSLIGIDRFVSAFAAAPYFIILLYWLGQWAIAASAKRPQWSNSLIQAATPKNKSL